MVFFQPAWGHYFTILNTPYFSPYCVYTTSFFSLTAFFRDPHLHSLASPPLSLNGPTFNNGFFLLPILQLSPYYLAPPSFLLPLLGKRRRGERRVLKKQSICPYVKTPSSGPSSGRAPFFFFLFERIICHKKGGREKEVTPEKSYEKGENAIIVASALCGNAWKLSFLLWKKHCSTF